MTATRDRILAAAKELVVDHGSDAVSMRKIGTTVGVTAMAVYRHFPHREALLDAVAEECFTELAAAWSRVRMPADVAAGSAVIVDLFVDAALDNPGLFSFMFIERRTGARRFPDDFGSGESPTFELLGAYVSQAIAEGQLRPVEPWRLALAYTALIHGLTQMYIGGRVNLSPDRFRRLCHDTTELLLHGITPR